MPMMIPQQLTFQEGLISMTYDSDKDSDDGKYHPICTQSGRAIHSTQQDPKYICITIGSDISFLQQVQKFEVDHSRNKVKPLIDHEYHNFVRTLKFLEHHEEYSDFLYDYATTRISILERLKVHDADEKASVLNEINNLVSPEYFDEVPFKTLTDKQKKQTLSILMLMLLKQDGKQESQGCADGRTQYLWTSNQEILSPTPAFEALKYILAIIGLEAHDVASFDLPAQFLQTDMDKILHLKITGALVLLLVSMIRTDGARIFRKKMASRSYMFYARKPFAEFWMQPYYCIES